jgi:hypothetical protein
MVVLVFAAPMTTAATSRQGPSARWRVIANDAIARL